MKLLLQWLAYLHSGLHINSATTNKMALPYALIIEIVAKVICLAYGVYHLLNDNFLIAFFAFVSTLFLARLIYLTLKENVDIWSLLIVYAAQTLALGIMSYSHGIRGLILMFPMIAGVFYFLEFRLATVLSVFATAIALACSLHALPFDMVLRTGIALALSIVFCACFSSVAMGQFRKSRFEATHDFLTEVPNRRGFLAWLQIELNRSKAKQTDLVLYFIDLDKFKSINDCFGHSIGDELLKTFAKRLLNTIRSVDLITRGEHIANLGRLAGDEFAFATHGVTDSNEAERFADRLAQVMSRTYYINHLKIDISISIGFCFASQVGWSLDELIECADKKMYEHKKGERSSMQKA